jgi:hypothetical protein
MVVLLVAAAAVVGAPLVAALLVSVASLREEAEHNLASRPRNWIEAAARRLLGFDAGNRRPPRGAPGGRPPGLTRGAVSGNDPKQLARR